MVTENAYAKVNLSLNIVGTREDGYHLVRMVMQSLNLADVLTFEKKVVVSVDASEEERIETLLLDKRGTDSDELGTLPLGSDNLIVKAARLLLEKYVWPKHPELGVKITLEKNIPIAAGMAGGSSDAAATFRGLNNLFELGIMEKDLMEMSVTLGADIPYCIMGGTALSEGIGEELTRLPSLPECYILIAKPMISISTAEAYGGYDRIAGYIPRPDVDAQVDAVYAGSIAGIVKEMGNVLEAVTAADHPEVGQLEEMMMDAGAEGAMMSGSGPTVFGIFKDKEIAAKAAQMIENSGTAEQIFVAEPV